MQWSRMKIPTILLAVVALVIGMSTGAVAAKLITGADIKNGSVTSADIKNGTLVTKDLKKGGVSADRLKKASIGSQKLAAGAVHSGKIKDGTIESKDLSEAAKNSLKTTYAGPNWGIVDRNVQGGGDSYLRAGPTVTTASGVDAPPLGIGSLGIRTAGPSDKAAFGDQVDYVGDPFSDVTQIGYSVFATGEDFTGGATNLPSISFELSFPAGRGQPVSTRCSTSPVSVRRTWNKWTAKDACCRRRCALGTERLLPAPRVIKTVRCARSPRCRTILRPTIRTRRSSPFR